MLSKHDFIDTFSENYFRFDSPDDSRITITDIAHSLSHMPRWNCHTTEMITVAQHSLVVSELCPPRLKLLGLLHDTAETYTGDYPAPFKNMLKYEYQGELISYRDLEDEYLDAILLQLGVPSTERMEVNCATIANIDEAVGLAEAIKLFGHFPSWVKGRSDFIHEHRSDFVRAGFRIDSILVHSPEQIEEMFIDTYKRHMVGYVYDVA